MRAFASTVAFIVALAAVPASAAELSILAFPSISDRQPWATGIQGEANLPGLGGYDVRAVARAVASLTNGFTLTVPARPPSSVDTRFHFLQVGVTFSRSYRRAFDLYVGGGYAWEHSDYQTSSFAGFGASATGSTNANGPTAEAGIRVPIGRTGDIEAGVLALFAQPSGQLCDSAAHCGTPDSRAVLAYPYVGLGVRF